jgi:hypothetical protein
MKLYEGMNVPYHSGFRNNAALEGAAGSGDEGGDTRQSCSTLGKIVP